METATYNEDSRQRIQNRLSSAVKTKLMGNGIENSDELSIKFIEMMAAGHSKEEILAELEKNSKIDEHQSKDQVERHNKSFVDWLFGYSSVVSAVKKKEINVASDETPLTEADTEVSNEHQLKEQQTTTPQIEDVTDDDDDMVVVAEPEDEKNDGVESDDSDDIPELQSKDSDDEHAEEPKTENSEAKTEAAEEKKPEVPKRRSFIRIKEGKSGRFTPIKSEDRHSFVKRNLARHASQLDVAAQVQKKVMSHAVAVANASENLTLSKKKSTASLNGNSLEKKKSFRRDSNASNTSSTPSVYSSTNATFIQSFAGKTFPKTSKTATTTTTNINASTTTPDKSKAVRCTYWPNCNRGEECKFWHPKELCPNLNNCPDGDQCLYIHPAPTQTQLNKIKNKKKSESTLEVSEGAKHGMQKKLTKRESMASICSNSSQSKKVIKTTKEVTTAIECKYGANCTRPDCKFSHPSPAAILANALKKKESGKLKEKKSHDLLKHKESRNSNKLSTEEAQPILCRFGSECKRANCKFLHK